MNRICKLLMLAAAGLVSVACATTAGTAKPEAGDRLFDYDYQMRTLDNGLKVVVLRTSYPDLVSLQIPVNTGSRNEVEAGKSGFAHFFEHMMFRGTKKRSSEEQVEILRRLGADDNAYTSDDLTNYQTQFTRDALDEVLELQADRFQNLSFSEDVFRTEAQAVKGEYLKNISQPIQKLYEQLRAQSFDVHPYSHTTMGFLEDIEDMPNQYEYGKTFFERWYCPQNASVIVVGDIDPEATLAMVEKHWGSWQCENAPSVEIPIEPPPSGPKTFHLQWEAPTQPTVAVAFRGPALISTEKDMPAMDLISQVYFGETSELYQQLVVDEQIADLLGTYFPDRKDPNLLMVYARVGKAEHVARVTQAIYAEVARARTERIPEAKLDAAKSALRNGFALDLNSSDAIAAAMASAIIFEGTPETINRQFARYAELDADDVMAYANRYLTDAGRVTGSISNDAALPAMSELVGIEALVKSSGVAQIQPVTLPSDSPLIDVSLVFQAGAADDPPGKKGLAMLTARMVADAGTAERDYKAVVEAQYPIAAGLSAQVDKQMTRFAGTVHRDALAGWTELTLERLLQPGWREADFERVKQQQINNIKTDLRSSNDEELAKEVLYAKLYEGHPYGTLNLGAVSDLEAISLDDVQAYYRKHYTQNALTLGLAGDYGEGYEAELLEALSALPVGVQRERAVPAAPPLEMRQLTIIDKPSTSVAVSFGFPIAVKRGDPDWVALWLVRSWLGEHRSFNSHLFKRIRELRGMNYGDYAYIEYFPQGMFTNQPPYNMARDEQIFQVWLRPLRSNNDAHFATRIAMHELQQLIDQGLTAEQFEGTRDYLSRFVAQRLQTQAAQLGYAIDSQYYGTPEFLSYVRDGMAALSLEQVNAAIRRHLQTDNLHFVMISADPEDLKERLILDKPSPLQYNAPPPAEIQAEDKQLMDSKLWFKRRNVEIIPLEQLFR